VSASPRLVEGGAGAGSCDGPAGACAAWKADWLAGEAAGPPSIGEAGAGARGGEFGPCAAEGRGAGIAAEGRGAGIAAEGRGAGIAAEGRAAGTAAGSAAGTAAGSAAGSAAEGRGAGTPAAGGAPAPAGRGAGTTAPDGRGAAGRGPAGTNPGAEGWRFPLYEDASGEALAVSGEPGARTGIGAGTCGTGVGEPGAAGAGVAESSGALRASGDFLPPDTGESAAPQWLHWTASALTLWLHWGHVRLAIYTLGRQPVAYVRGWFASRKKPVFRTGRSRDNRPLLFQSGSVGLPGRRSR
jgi:hypothetical protein